MKHILFLFLVMTMGSAYAQQYFSHGMYLKNRFGLNPATAGADSSWKVTTQLGTLLNGMSDSPRNAQFLINGRTSVNTGLGVQIKSFNTSFFQAFSAQLAGSYTARLNDDHSLTWGISTGLLYRSIDYSKIMGNPFVDPSDPLLNANYFNKSSFRIETAMMYKFRGLEASIILPQFYDTELNLNTSLIGVASYELNFNTIDVTPVIMFAQYKNQPAWADFAALVEWNKMLWAQLGYRSNKSMNAAFGVKVKDLTLGYSYNQPFSVLSDIFSGGHDILLTIQFGKKKA